MASITYYVSAAGSDNNPGTDRAHPFGTVNHAKEAARAAAAAGDAVTVEFLAGTYAIGVSLGGAEAQTLDLDERDNGISYVTREGAVLTGGLSIPVSAMTAVTGEARDLFRADVVDRVRCADLKKYGVPEASYAGPYPIGFTTASLYDGYVAGVNIEVFENDARMTLARYPDTGYLELAAIMDQGETPEYPEQNYWPENWKKRNPRPGTYIFDKETQKAAQTWKHTENAWIFGYLYHDWADTTVPVTIDAGHRAVTPRYVAQYGARAGAKYYFFNIPDVLDVPGEWYVDKENGILYVYPSSEESVISLSVCRDPLVSFHGARNVTLSGFTLECTANTAVVGSGTGLLLHSLYVHNVGKDAVHLSGRDILVERCEAAHTGHGGISVDGGDRATLTHGNNMIRNCYVHDYSDVAKTYTPGLSVGGVGNTIAHCEVCRTPHMAISYGGNEHLIEYNYIHEAVMYSMDAGAIYSGRDWAGHGTVIRYNILEHVGCDELHPDGIYWDDTLSGQTAYGNILIDVKKNGFLVGGGRDNVVRDNIILGESEMPIQYDDRARDGVVNNGWARAGYIDPNGGNWTQLKELNKYDAVWKERYPTLFRLRRDLDDADDPECPINPAGAVVENNVIINERAYLGEIADSVYKYSRVEGNSLYHSCEEADFDPKTLRFKHPREGFPEIPVEKIGIEKE